MNSIDPKHTEPTSGNQQGAEEHSGPCSSESLTGHVDPAIVEKPALDTATMNLMEQIVDPANLDCAWERVKANRGVPGPDGITIDAFPDHIRDHWPKLRQQLLDGTFTARGPNRQGCGITRCKTFKAMRTVKTRPRTPEVDSKTRWQPAKSRHSKRA